MSRLGWTLLVLAGALAGACSPAAKRMAEDPAAVRAYEARFHRLAPMEKWEIKGRLAITDGTEGGSGALVWVQDGEQTRMEFRGTLGQGNWRLESDGRSARLELGNGQRFEAASVAELVAAQAGWNVPVDALSWWVRGLAAQSAWEERRLDSAGRLMRLRQAGWEVDFGSYREQHAASLPSRLTARRGEQAVKLVVREWLLGG